MSMIAAHMQKFKVGQLNGLARHDERQNKNYKNPDIDLERSELNFSVKPHGQFDAVWEREKDKTLQTRVTEKIADERTATRAVRKDAVVLNEWVIGSDKAFFQDKDLAQTRQFFKDVYWYFSQRYGAEHIPYATVHMDETTPHLHMGIIPLRDGKLSSKALFTREALRRIQAELPDYLHEAGWQIERGVKGSKRRHLSVEDYKASAPELEQAKAELAHETAYVNELRDKAMKDIQRLGYRLDGDPLIKSNELVPETKFKLLGDLEPTGRYIITGEAYKRLKSTEKSLVESSRLIDVVEEREKRVAKREEEVETRERAIAAREAKLPDMSHYVSRRAYNDLELERRIIEGKYLQLHERYLQMADVVRDMAKAIGTLISNRDDWRQPLTDFGERVVIGVRKYAKKALEKFAIPQAREIDTTVSLTKEIEQEMYPEKKQQEQKKYYQQRNQGMER
jgi:hypothetical protein